LDLQDRPASAADATGPAEFGRDDDVICLPATVGELPVERFIREAIRVFEQTGRDPRAHRMELRQEEFRGSDHPMLGAEFETSIVFIPRQTGDLYPVSVRAKQPCVVSWLWEPDRFTDWQRRVLRRAQELSAGAWEQLIGDRLVDVEVSESRDAVAVRLWRVEEADRASNTTEIFVVLNKTDLEPVDTHPNTVDPVQGDGASD
jgi:hypothetical protein